MKKFVIKVNGNVYEVEVEETENFKNTPISASAPATAPAPKAAPAPAPAAAPAGSNVVSAPMPGTILDIKVSVGQSVNAGDVLCVLEAMKMENEIVAPRDGTVAEVLVQRGVTVGTDAPLVVLK